jgi:hypothetical protein
MLAYLHDVFWQPPDLDLGEVLRGHLRSHFPFNSLRVLAPRDDLIPLIASVS